MYRLDIFEMSFKTTTERGTIDTVSQFNKLLAEAIFVVQRQQEIYFIKFDRHLKMLNFFVMNTFFAFMALAIFCAVAALYFNVPQQETMLLKKIKEWSIKYFCRRNKKDNDVFVEENNDLFIEEENYYTPMHFKAAEKRDKSTFVNFDEMENSYISIPSIYMKSLDENDNKTIIEIESNGHCIISNSANISSLEYIDD